MNVNPELASFAIARDAKVGGDAKLEFDWLPYASDEGKISSPPTSAQSIQFSVSVEQVDDVGVAMRILKYPGSFACCRMLKAFACMAGKRFINTDEGLSKVPKLDEQDSLKVEEKKFVAAVPVVSAVPPFDFDAWLAVDEDEVLELEGAVALGEVECVEVK